MIKRELLKTIEEKLFKGKAVIILGPRQVGKTTLLHFVQDDFPDSYLWLSGDEADVRQMLSHTTSTRLNTLIGPHKVVIIDDAQRIPDVGLTVKLIVDNFPHIQILVSGSSSFEFTSEVNEPLTGRKYEYCLYPISYKEMVAHTSLLEENRLLEHRLMFGYYPEVITKTGEERALLSLLAESYLYKDVFTYEKIRKTEKAEKLVQALALQLGSEVNAHELSQLIGADNETVERYLTILERAFVIFRISSLSRNIRNEIKKGRKFYFYDNGIRNSIIKNHNPLSLRQDTGALWENFLVSERIKHNHYLGRYCNYFFWRTHAQQEIDYIEEREGKLFAYEFKWSEKKKAKSFRTFSEAYPQAEVMTVTRENFSEFLLE